jgi:hypothetical protein
MTCKVDYRRMTAPPGPVNPQAYDAPARPPAKEEIAPVQKNTG